MYGNTTRIAVSLTPHGLRGAVYRSGRVLRAERIDLDPAVIDGAWEQGLTDLDRPLRQLLTRLSLGRGRPIISVMYHGRSVVAQTHEIPGRADDARRAAIMKARESGGETTTVNGEILAPSALRLGSSMVLTLSDREQESSKIYAWITRCGGRLDAVIPEVSVVVRAAVARVMSAETVQGCCYIGTDWAAIACGSKSGLIMVRAFEFGHSLLADVFQRALGDGSAMIDASAGERALFEHGLPFKSTEINPELRARVLPLVAPVLQRFCVEVKQTVRFGVPADRQPSEIVLDGPGACIAHLASSITESINMHVSVAPGLETARPLDPFGQGTAERSWVVSRTGCVDLVPQIAVEQRSIDLMKGCLAAGVVTAGLLIGAEYLNAEVQRRSLEGQFATISPVVASMDRAHETMQGIRKLGVQAGAVARRVTPSPNQHTDWPGVLALVASLTSEAVRLDDFDGRVTPTGIELRLRGIATGPDDDAASDAMAAFVHGLQASDLITLAQIGGTTREQNAEGRATRQFSLTLTLAPVPAANTDLIAFASALAVTEKNP